MKYSQKAQISLVKSVLLYGAKAFALIYALLLVFLSLSEITTALIKSRSFGVDFIIFVKPMLILLPTLLSVAVPYVFLITLFLVIRKLKQNNFFQFTTIYPTVLRYLISAGILVSLGLSGAIYSLQENVLEKFDNYIEKEIKEISKRPIVSILEPLKFNHYGDIAIYLSSIPDQGINYKIAGHIYKIKNGKVRFVGRGEIYRSNKGDLFAQNVWGLELDNKGKAVKKIANKKFSILRRVEKNYKALAEYKAIYKKYLSNPELPLSDKGKKAGYPWPGKLKKIKKYQSLLYTLSPLIFFTVLFCIIFGFKRLRYVSDWYTQIWNKVVFFLAFLWCLTLLTFPYFIKIDYHKEPSYSWFLVLIISLIILFAINFLDMLKKIFLSIETTRQSNFFKRYLFLRVKAKIERSESSLKGLSRLKNLINDIKIKKNQIFGINSVYLDKIKNLNKNIIFFSSHSKLFVKIFLIFAKWVLLSHLSVFILMLIYRTFVTWKLTQGMDNLYWFTISQLLTLPENIFSLSPYIMIGILPVIFFEVNKAGIFVRSFLMGINFKKYIVSISFYGILFVSYAFFLREEYGYHWKRKGTLVYRAKILHLHYTIVDDEVRLYNDFIRLSDGSILFFEKLKKKNGKNIFYNIMIDGLSRQNRIVTAKKATAYKYGLYLENGNLIVHNQIKSSKGSDKFFIKNIPIHKLDFNDENFFIDSVERFGNFEHSPTFSLIRRNKYRIFYKKKSKKYLHRIIAYRVLPVILFFILSAGFIIVNQRLWIMSNKGYSVLYGAFNIVILGFFVFTIVNHI